MAIFHTLFFLIMLIKTKTSIINFANCANIAKHEDKVYLLTYLAGGRMEWIGCASEDKRNAAFEAICEAIARNEKFIDISDFQA